MNPAAPTPLSPVQTAAVARVASPYAARLAQLPVLLALALVLLLVLAPNLEAQRRAGRKLKKGDMPEWVRQRPTDPNYFVGIGKANIQANPDDYMQVARKAALNDMAQDIIVYLDSENTLNQSSEETQQDGSYSYFLKDVYTADINTYTRNRLAGYQEMDNWNSGTEYWTYYRLSRTEYIRLKRQEWRKNESTALDMEQRATSAEQNAQLYRALQNYTRALELMLPYTDPAMEAEFRGPANQYAARLYRSLTLMLSRTRLSGPEETPRYRKGQVEGLAVEVSATYTDPDEQQTEPVGQLPLSLYFSKGKGRSLNEKVVTNPQGVASFQLRDVTPSGQSLEITAEVDLREFALFDSTRHFALNPDKLPRPRVVIPIATQGPRVVLAFRETNLNQRMRPGILEAQVKRYLTQNGCEVVRETDEYDWVVKLEANTRQGGQAGGYYMTYLDYHLQVLTPEREEQFTESAMDIKGRKFDWTNAGRAGFQRAAQQLESDVLPRLLQVVYNY